MEKTYRIKLNELAKLIKEEVETQMSAYQVVPGRDHAMNIKHVNAIAADGSGGYIQIPVGADVTMKKFVTEKPGLSLVSFNDKDFYVPSGNLGRKVA
jgi:hypothetical protein